MKAVCLAVLVCSLTGTASSALTAARTCVVYTGWRQDYRQEHQVVLIRQRHHHLPCIDNFYDLYDISKPICESSVKIMFYCNLRYQFVDLSVKCAVASYDHQHAYKGSRTTIYSTSILYSTKRQAL